MAWIITFHTAEFQTGITLANFGLIYRTRTTSGIHEFHVIPFILSAATKAIY